jgi:hypothetical protein
MRFSGKVFREERVWLAEIPILEAMTQGSTRKQAVEMAKDMVETMVGVKGFRVDVYPGKGEDFEVGSVDPKPLVRLLLQRKRELSGLSLAQAAERLGASSRNAYARYEKGTSVPSVAKFLELLQAVSPETDIVIQDSRHTTAGKGV